MGESKRRLVGPSGALFVPGPRVDEATIAGKIAAGEWKEATDKQVAEFHGTHPPKKPAKKTAEPAEES